MDFNSLIDTLKNCNEPILVDSAAKLNRIKDELDKGNLSAEEAAELINDLKDAEEIKNLASTLEQKIMFDEACSILLKIITTLL